MPRIKYSSKAPKRSNAGTVWRRELNGDLTVGVISTNHEVGEALGKQITDALDPTKAPSRGQTLSEMSEEKRAQMLALYGRKP